ncbi:MAG TPA: glycosyltransferase [Candidatus Bathyarchaeia archaeon]|nr:glycosyltransferase [Candidatus Bathyarchaeia archaeon]
MINDCAFVGETLLKYLPPDLEKKHITHSRGLLSKTFSLAYKILRARGDVYHAHYLLQDCYIAARLGKKPLVGHAHGSDLRQELRNRKWGWIVKYNLLKSHKIFVAQPTILEIAKEFNETAEYLPIPFDPEIFFPKPLPENKEKIVFLASAHNFKIKGTDKFLRALASLPDRVEIKSLALGNDFLRAQQLSKDLNLNIEFIEGVPHNRMHELYWGSDIVLGSYGVGQLDTVAIEAMACGRPVVHSVSRKFFQTCPLEELESSDKATEIISRLLMDRRETEARIKKQLLYVNSVHSAPLLAERVMNVYSELRKDMGRDVA